MRFLFRRIIYLSLLLGILVVPLVLLNSEWREAAMRGGSDILGKLVSLPGQLFSSDEQASVQDDSLPLSPLAEQMQHLAKRFHDRNGKLGRFSQVLDCGAARSDMMRELEGFTKVTDDQGQEGVRVTLVTGDQLDDLAGSLTYWFDNRGRTCRIQFEGVTGDPGRLISYVQRTQRLSPLGCPVNALFMRDGRVGPRHVLHISRPSVVNLKTLYGRYQVAMELNISGQQLSPGSMKLLAAGS